MSDYLIWECLVCGFIYDEAEGWPDDGIAPGTRWADVPDDWYCPDCGVGKEDFEMRARGPSQAQAPAEPEAASGAENQAQPAAATLLAGQAECSLCSWTYLPALAAPSQSIGPNTPFTDLPGDFRCPACGAPASAFDAKVMASAPLIIVGTGLAGYNLAREWRKLDGQTPLLIISADDGAFYSKPVLSTGFAKGQSPEQMVSSDAQTMARQLNAKILTHTEVSNIDTEAQTLIAGGSSYSYSKLVLAVGSEAIAPPLTGTGLHKVFTVNDLTDYRRFQQAIEGQRRLLIIGAGLIGSEYANDLAQTQRSIHVVDPLASPLGSLMPAAVGRAIQRGLEAHGVQYHLGTVVASIEDHDSGVLATLANGEQIEADLVLSAIGVRPRTSLAQAAGLLTKRGIQTDKTLATSAANVYALGDCAEVAGHNLLYVMPLMHGARALAPTLAGQPTAVHYPPMPVMVKTTLCPVVVSPVAPNLPGDWSIEQEGDSVRALFHDAQGQLRGFALCGKYLREKDALNRQLEAIIA